MLGKAMRIATMCTLAFAICGERLNSEEKEEEKTSYPLRRWLAASGSVHAARGFGQLARSPAAEAADALAKAWASRVWIDSVEKYPTAPANVAELYETHLALQQHPLVDAELGGLGGYKLGAVGALGEACIYAPLFGRFLVDVPGAGLSAASIQMDQIEPEFGVVLGADLPARSDGLPHGTSDVWAAAESVVLAIECCGSRATSEVTDAQQPIGKYADSLSSGGAVLGPRLPASRFDAEALSSCAVSFFINGEAVAKGAGSACPEGGPVQALTWLANHLNQRGLGLKKGQLIMTGQTCNTRSFKIGDKVQANFDGLGSVVMVIAP